MASLVGLASLCLSPSLAMAEFGIAAFDGQVVADAAGTPYTQAGGTPYAVETTFAFTTRDNPGAFLVRGWPDEPARNVRVDLPPGLVGNPTGMPRCTALQLTPPPEEGGPQCPSGSQIGRIRVLSNGGLSLTWKPIFLMFPPPNVVARFGVNVANTPIVMDITVRSDGDYGVTVNARNAAEGIPFVGARVRLWGVPSDRSHDAERSCPGLDEPHAGTPEDPGPPGFACGTEAPRQSLVRMPTSCTVPGAGLPTTITAASWYDSGDFKSASFVSHLPPGLFSTPPVTDPLLWGPPQGPESCDRVPFDPTFEARPDEGARAGAPSGYTFDLSLPQTTDPEQIAQGDLRKAVVTLPEGLRVSPPSAWGLGGCSSAQIGLRSMADARCPDASKIGKLRIETPALDEPLAGAVYLATPHDNPSRTLLGLYLVAKGPGVVVKLAGRVDADPQTGQLRTTFEDNPQLPFSNLHLELKGGDRAALVNPPRCGTYTTRAVLTSWSGRTVTSESSFAISRDGKGAPCSPSRFAPDFIAGVDNPVAGAFSSFRMQLARDEVDEELRTVTVRLPEGLSARRAGVTLCSAARAESGTCGDESRIGEVTVGAGAGLTPFYIDTGRVYLTEGYKGAPFGLSIVVPAVAGPFDLGTVVVRSAVHVDRRTTAVRVISDPLPVALEGIPLQVRDVRINLDRERVIVNPTSCETTRIDATLVSTAGTRVNTASRFEVGECARLRLRPRMRMIVGAKGRTGANRSTPFVTRLTQTAGQTNLKSVSVSLPLVLNARLDVVEDACTMAEFRANDCARARTGTVVAKSPLLPDPLRGGAFFVENPSRALPDLVLALRGEVDVDVVGKIKIPDSNRLTTTFDSIPDVPITAFTLRLRSGENGALGAARNLCRRSSRRGRAKVVYVGHNGRVLRKSQRLIIRGCRR
ncbi:MAG: hypothetical protein WAQ33_16880 [Gaiellaceae bacterium]